MAQIRALQAELAQASAAAQLAQAPLPLLPVAPRRHEEEEDDDDDDASEDGRGDGGGQLPDVQHRGVVIRGGLPAKGWPTLPVGMSLFFTFTFTLFQVPARSACRFGVNVNAKLATTGFSERASERERSAACARSASPL